MMLPHTAPASPTQSPAPAAASQAARGIRNTGLWLIVLCFLGSYSPLSHGSEDSAPPEGTGAFHFLDNAGQREAPATLLKTDYRVRVSGLMADTRLRQRFENTSQHWREGVFVFPLPENASVHALTMTAGERVIVGEIQERQEAKRQYDQARKEGRQVARVDQERPNLFTTRLANIPPGESVSIELHYQQTVRYQSGHFELRLPTTLTPRYMPGKPQPLGTDSAEEHQGPADWHQGWARPTQSVPDAHRISPHTVLPGDLAPGSHRAQVHLTLKAGLPIGAVTSPSHALNTAWNGETVTVTPQAESLLMDQDLVVRWAPVRGQTPSAAVFHERWQGEDYLMALLVPGLESRSTLPRELIFVIDTSGSMGGDRVRQARKALLRGLETLSPGDTFNVIQFNSETRTLYPQPQAVNARTLARARQYVRGLNAEGGTVMAPALEQALTTAAKNPSNKNPSEQVRQVLFITDGAVGNEAELYQQIRAGLAHSRLFTVGIGAAPNMHFLREAARFGRGSYTAITDTADLSGQLDELLGKMQSPVLTDLRATWPGVASKQVFPARPGDLFQGEPMIQVARGAKAKGELTLTGRLPDGASWQRTLPLDQAAAAQGLHRHWAREKIDSLTDQRLAGADPDVTQAAITHLGLRHQLLTAYTSFVAIDRTPVRPEDAALHTGGIPTLLPRDNGPGLLRYPRTATRSGLYMSLGALGLILCLALLWRPRRRVAP